MPETQYGTLEEGGNAGKEQSVGEAFQSFPKSTSEAKDQLKSAWKRYFAEMFGTMMFVYLVSVQLSSSSFLTSSTGYAFTTGLSITVLMVIFGGLSGAHFNPAISVAQFIAGRMSLLDVIFYILSQILGAFIGALIAEVSYSSFSGATHPGASVSWFEGVLTEMMLTGMLATAYLVITEFEKNRVSIAVVIGIAYMLNVFVGGRVSGASSNPARSLGTAIVTTIFGGSGAWTMHYVYWAGPLLGSCVAALVYKLLLADEKNRWCNAC